MKKVLVFINMAVVGFIVAFLIIHLLFKPQPELFEESLPDEEIQGIINNG